MKSLKMSAVFVLLFLNGFQRSSAMAQSVAVRNIVASPGHEIKTLSQNWSDADASWFYNVAQGSYLLRYEWFVNLEQADSEKLFRDSSHFQSLGYLARTEDTDNPHGLAVGFVRDDKPLPNGGVESYLGMTCAACHTGHVNFGGKTYIIDGAPTNGNFEKLQRSLVTALEATLSDVAKFDRFAAKVLEANASTDDNSKLKSGLQKALADRKAYNNRNLPKNGAAPFGHGRVDAFGSIMNEVAVRFAQVQNNATPATAPVSYPVLWDAPQHDFVQWNGAAENKRSVATKKLVGTEYIGALGRNTGEVLGVFGEIDATVEPSIAELRHYPNSAKRDNLIAIEDSLRNLWSPEWPAEFPAIKEDLKNQGADLFDRHCASCHESIVRDDPGREVVARLSDEHTDPQMALNFLMRKGRTGVLQGRRVEPLSVNHDKFEADAPVGLMLKHLVQRAIIRSTDEILAEGQQHIADLFNQVQSAVDYQISGAVSENENGTDTIVAGRFGFGGTHGVTRRVRDLTGRLLRTAEARLERAVSQPGDIKLNYKARPLNGIWASAPYLHNGSIPNLDELLKRPNERSQAVFNVGSREFDPVKVGFKTDTGEDFNPTLPGNLNTGHDYGHEDGRSFSDEERKQLMEYMKSL
ncbi:MAG: di-heme-cytochrome C peroxidase [Planctomycetaceae bacterium]